MITTIWLIGLVLFIIGCFLAKQYNKWMIANFPRREEDYVTKTVITVMGIMACIPFVGIVSNTILIMVILVNWIYLKHKDRWNEPF